MVALLALALQFASNFGHFHREWAGQSDLAHAETASRAGHDHDHHDHDEHNGQTPHSCSICIAVSFAQGFTPLPAPALPAFTAEVTSRPTPESDAPTTARLRGPFQSRAPPLA